MPRCTTNCFSFSVYPVRPALAPCLAVIGSFVGSFDACGQPIEEGRKQGQPPRLAKYCLKCRTERRRRARVKYTWLPEHDAYLKAHYFGGLNRRFQVLTRMVRLIGLPRWYIKRQAARLGLTMKMDRRSWTEAESDRLENLVGRVSSATIAKRLHRPESSIVNKLKRMGTSRRVRDGYAMRELELCIGEDHHKIPPTDEPPRRPGELGCLASHQYLS